MHKPKTLWMRLAGLGIVLAVVGLAIPLLSQTPSNQGANPNLTTRPDRVAEPTQLAQEITVFRSPSCGCCELWMEHLTTAGFQIQDRLTEDTAAIKQQHAIPEELTSCHTALVDGYVVEGHVPATEIQRLLTEKPNIAGLAVPGMPIGSPGMESGDYVEPYTVLALTSNGETAPFAEYP